MDSVSGSVSDFTLQNPANLDAPFDAVKIGEYDNIPDNIESNYGLNRK